MGNGKPAPVTQAPGVPTATGELIVTVTDPAANALPAAVTVEMSSGNWTIDADKKTGIADFNPIPVGTYKVKVSHPGHGPVPAAGKPFAVGAVEDTVTVVASPTLTERNAILTPPLGFLRVLVRKGDHKTQMPKIPVKLANLLTKVSNEFGIADFGPQPTGVFFDIVAGPADPKTKPFVGPPMAPPAAVLIGPAKTVKSLSVGEFAQVPLELEERKLEIVKIDDHFASSKENLDIRFSILGLAGRTVKLTIEGENYAGKKMVDRDLTADETKDGANNLIAWTGKIEIGADKDRFATPLMGPFKVQLFHDDAAHLGVLKSEKPFKILYHSLALEFGKHTADGTLPPEATQQARFVQAKLNDLHYDAGPVSATLAAANSDALRRFQRANYQVGTQTILTVNGTADANTIAAIKAASPREIFEAGKTPLTQDAKFYVYDNFLTDRNTAFVPGTLTEFNAGNRQTSAEDKMERPFIPLEVEVKLLNKAGNGISAPDAIGPVPVAWEVNDAPEVDVTSAANAAAKTYLKHAREIGTTATVAGAARIDQTGDNALDTFDGPRKSTGAGYIASWFPNNAANTLDPYSIVRYDTETRGGTVFDRAVVNAFADPVKTPRCKGRAGIYFRFSYKGGDNAKVRVSLTFKGLPNETTLENDHKPGAAKLVSETGRWTVWRRTRFSAYCQMATPTRASGSPDWANIRDRFKEAYIEVENNGVPLQMLTYTTVVPSATYISAITGMPTPNSAGAPAAAALTYRTSSIYGGAVPAQNPGESAAAYITRATGVMIPWVTDPINAVLKVVHDRARLTSPEGYVIFDFRVFDPFDAQDWNPALNGGAGGFQPTTNPAFKQVKAGISGYVHCSGAVTMNVDNTFNVNCYLAHECGHARFLYHHSFVPEAPSNSSATSANANQHDGNQTKCTMSYAAPGDSPDNWRYPFCGKCILRLRGWNVLVLPNKYT